MRKFETLLLLSPELAADAREALLGTFTGVIERARIIRISDGAFKFLTVKLADAAEEVA